MISPEVVRARNGVMAAFALSGLMMSTWVSRVPALRDNLELTPGQLGRVLLAAAAGSVLALPTAGLAVNRLGARLTVALGAGLSGAGVLTVGLGGGPLTSVWAVLVGLFAFGYGIGAWDVAMNVEGAAVERRLERAIMPRLHAGFSLGTVAGAGLGAAAAAVELSLAVHLGVLAGCALVATVLAARAFLPAGHATGGQAPRAEPERFRVWHAWREPRTVLIGVLVLSFALAEGIANDWLAVALVDGLGASNAVGAAGFAVFLAAMTAARTLGTAAIDRYGRVPVLRASAALGVAGVLLVVFGGSLPVALLGALCWGLGTALGFPIGMSAGADDPRRAAIRVSVVASIGYTAFLAGPPLLGWLGDHFGVQRALLLVLVAMVLGAVVAAATRESDRVVRRRLSSDRRAITTVTDRARP